MNIYTSILKTTLATILLFFFNFAISQNVVPEKNILVVFYNVENLFDTIDDPHKNDNEFLPSSKKVWNSEKYSVKLQKLSEVLGSIDKKKLPDIIGLAEIENAQVVKDLAITGKLKKVKYHLIHFESPDSRSIDVALLLKNKQFKILKSQALKISIEAEKNFKTRDILYVKILHYKSKDTLHIFVNHWPSRLGGEEKSSHKREAAASILKAFTDSIINTGSHPKIIIMGDLNDEPNNYSIRQVLIAHPSDSLTQNADNLFNLSYPLFRENKGSYYYSREKKWNMIDNMIVTGNLLTAKNGIKSFSNSITIFQPDWILHTDKNGIKSPAKTYGAEYFGGYSDHLPIFQYFLYTRFL